MVLEETSTFSSPDPSQFAWSGLRRFQNVDIVCNLISELHDVSKNHENTKKQAAQIRYCLLQAKEYFDATKSVSLVTKPVLYYYSIMSLALAEILLKQDGNSSLDAARAENRSHGLSSRVELVSRTATDLAECAAKLVAVPSRSGTFRLWHKSCREMPICGKVHQTVGPGQQTSRYALVIGADDKELPELPSSGVSFLDCIRLLPGMEDFLLSYGIRPSVIRGVVDVQMAQDLSRRDYRLIVHPGEQRLISEFLNSVSFDANAVDWVNMNEYPSGCLIKWQDNPVSGYIGVRIPHASMLRTDEIRFWTSVKPLNEFGYLYLGLYMAGNYARYFPDGWLRDVELSTPLALAVEELLRIAEFRMPLLALSEMARVYMVPRA